MKKKLLFVIPNLGAGGAEKALVNLVYALSEEQGYEIDVLVFNKSGLFLNQLPASVKLLSPEGDYPAFSQGLVKAVVKLLLKGKWKLAYTRWKYAKTLRSIHNPAVAEQRAWKYWQKAMPMMPQKYDAAIGFLEKSSIYYVVDKVQARVKMGWIHNDYTKLGLDSGFDRLYFEKLTYLVSVSDHCVEVLREIFPKYKNRIKLIHNITSKKLIWKYSNELPKELESEEHFYLVSLGRLDKQKGFDLGIHAIAQLPTEIKFKMKWLIIGEGAERTALETLIKEYGLEAQIQLLGTKSNPYPYIRKADVYFQPSRFEGKSIAIDEAKLLAKPILTTNFSTVLDQLTPEKTAIITEMNAEAIGEGIERLYKDEVLRQHLSANLKDFDLDIKTEIQHFKDLCNG